MECPRRITPVVGRWTLPGFPPVVIVRGHRFVRVLLALPQRGVVAHYRQDVARMSAHLVVTTSGDWRIDHLDCRNPTFGPFAALDHIARDVVAGGPVTITRASWWSEMRAAAEENARDPVVGASFDKTPIEGLSTAIASRVSYRFTEDQPVASSWRECRARRFAACADAVSLVGAVALRRGAVNDVSICLEFDESVPDYAHVRAMWRSPSGPAIVVDPWPEQSFRVNRCASQTPARDLFSALTLRRFARSH